MHKIIVFPIRLEGSYRKRMRRFVPNFTQDQIQRHRKKKKKDAIWIQDFLSVSNLKGINDAKIILHFEKYLK